MPRQTRPQSGEPFQPSASQQAWLICAAEYVDQLRARGNRQDLPIPPGGNPAIELILNSTGADRRTLEVVPLGDAKVFTPANSPPNYKNLVAVDAPASHTIAHWDRFAVLLEPIAEDNTGLAAFAGVTLARVSIDDVRLRYCELPEAPADPADPYILRASPGGPAEILWRDTDTGSDVICLVRIGTDKRIVDFVADQDHPGPGVPFAIRLGAEDPATDSLWYEASDPYSDPYASPYAVPQLAIDHRCGVPQPAAGAAGIGEWRPSDAHGRLLYVLDLDCSVCV